MLPSFTLFGRVVYTYPLMGGLACIAALLAAMKGSARYPSPGTSPKRRYSDDVVLPEDRLCPILVLWWAL